MGASEGMIVGIDIDGTITAFPEFFSIFTKSLRKSGAEIHIITARAPDQYTKEELESIDIVYDHLHEWDFDTYEETSSEWKARVCQENNVTILFDNDLDICARVQKTNAVVQLSSANSLFF